MKFKILALLLTTTIVASAQEKTYNYLPSNPELAVNFKASEITESISMDEMNSYAFVQMILKEMSNGKITKVQDLGISLENNIINFIEDKEYMMKFGFSFTLENKETFLQLDDLPNEMVEALSNGNEYIKESSWSSDITYFNLNNNVLNIVVIDMKYREPRNFVDSVFKANNWNRDGYSYNSEHLGSNDRYATPPPPASPEFEIVEEVVEAPAMEETVEMPEIVEEVPSDVWVEEIPAKTEVEAERHPAHLNHSEYLDSVKTTWANAELQNIKLAISNGQQPKAEIANFLQEDNEVNFYFSPGFIANEMKREFRGLSRETGIPQEVIQGYIEQIYNQELFTDLQISEDGYEINSTIKMNNFLADIYADMEFDKMDRKLVKYIPNSAPGYLALNANSYQAYKNLRDQQIAAFEATDDKVENSIALIWTALDQFIDVEAIYEAYPTEMVFAYNGFTNQEVRSVSYEYDENFNSTRTISTSTQNLPSFSLAIHSEDQNLTSKTFDFLAKHYQEYLTKVDDYYRLSLPTGPTFYFTINGEYLLASNDVAFVTTHKDGYGKDKLKCKTFRQVKRTKGVYAYADFKEIFLSIPSDVVGPRQYDMVAEFQQYMGVLELNSDFSNDLPSSTLKYTQVSGADNGLKAAANLVDAIFQKVSK